MVASRIILVLSFAYYGAYASLPLPSYISPCARSDPKFYECSLEHAIEAIPTFIEGDKKYGIPSLNPLEVSKMKLDNGPKQANINILLSNAKFYGVKNFQAKDIHFDVEGSNTYFEFDFPQISLLGDYEISGRILLLAITGKGKCNITLDNVESRFNADSKLVERNGVKYAEFYNPRFVANCSREYFDLTNLFNGDKLLGSEMLNLLNTNWRDTHKELLVPIIDGVGEIILTLINNFASRVPYDVWFPKTL